VGRAPHKRDELSTDNRPLDVGVEPNDRAEPLLRVNVGSGRLLPAGDDLPAKPELADESSVTLDVLTSHVLEQTATPSDHTKQASARVVILRMSLEVLGQLGDTAREDCDLDLRRTRVAFGAGVVRDDPGLLFL
jgi:hypothetical protein